MKQADVDAVIAQVARAGRRIDNYQSSVFCGAREILAREPDNPHAAKVVANFLAFVATGVETISFEEFLLPIPYTDEELAAQDASRAAYVAATRGAQQ